MMQTHHRTMNDLFDQLGLPSGDADIDAFVRRHRPLDNTVYLTDAPFWTPSQASFLREQFTADADWALPIDALSRALRDADPLPQAEPDGAAPGATTH